MRAWEVEGAQVSEREARRFLHVRDTREMEYQRRRSDADIRSDVWTLATPLIYPSGFGAPKNYGPCTHALLARPWLRPVH